MRVVAVLVLAVLVASLRAAPAPIAIVRAPAVVYESDGMTVFVQVEPAAENRGFWLVALDAGGDVRRSFQQLAGEQAAKSWWIEWRAGLPPGQFELVAVLVTTTGQAVSARRPVTVLSRR